jgi:hypothetical protein
VDALNEFGTYVFADGMRLDRVLAVAGFRAVHREGLSLPLRIGADVDDVIGYLLAEPEIQALMAGTPPTGCRVRSRRSERRSRRTRGLTASSWKPRSGSSQQRDERPLTPVE